MPECGVGRGILFFSRQELCVITTPTVRGPFVQEKATRLIDQSRQSFAASQISSGLTVSQRAHVVNSLISAMVALGTAEKGKSIPARRCCTSFTFCMAIPQSFHPHPLSRECGPPAVAGILRLFLTMSPTLLFRLSKGCRKAEVVLNPLEKEPCL